MATHSGGAVEVVIIGATKLRGTSTHRAASILYADWGTSKAYVVGLAFAIAGYSAFWDAAALIILPQGIELVIHG